MRAPLRRIAVALGFCAFCAMAALAFVKQGVRWYQPTIPMHLQLGTKSLAAIDGSTSFNQVGEAALGRWNQYLAGTRLASFSGSLAGNGFGNGINNVFFGSSIGGSSLAGALAITWILTQGSSIVEADVVFNTNVLWDSYRGALRGNGQGGTIYDFRRVAIHEFGHVLGLDHPDDFGQNVAAIMNSRVSNIDDLRADDINGAVSIYGGAPAPQPAPSERLAAPPTIEDGEKTTLDPVTVRRITALRRALANARKIRNPAARVRTMARIRARIAAIIRTARESE